MPTSPRGRPDEELFVRNAFQYFGHNPVDPRPWFWNGWPEGFYRITHWVAALEAWLYGVLWGKPVNLGCAYSLNPLTVHLGVRLFSALAGTAACLFVGLLVRRLAPRELRGPAFALGTLALGLNYLAARDAHFGVSDATLLLCVAACLYLLVRAVKDGARFLPLAGLVAGMGFGVKYAAAALFLPCLVAGVLCLARPRGSRGTALLFALMALPAAAFGFWLLSPHWIADAADVLRGLMIHRARYNDSARSYLLDPQAVLPPGWRFHLTVTLPAAFGWAGLALAALGVGWSVRREWAVGLVLAAEILGAFAFLVPVRTLFVRYASPTLPGLCAGLALCLLWSYAALRARLPSRVALGLALALGVVALGPPLRRLVAFDRLLSREDTREQVRDYLARQHATLLPQGGYAYVTAVQQAALDACLPVVPAWLLRPLPVLPGNDFPWAAAVREGPERWAAMAGESMDRYLTWFGPKAASAEYVTQARSVLECGKYGNTNGYGVLDPNCFHKLAVFDPGKPACGSYVDLFDSFFAPYSDFDGQVYTGPEITVFKNDCYAAPPPPRRALPTQIHLRPPRR
jgi:4-amino-4-deoxy-L-arabinose transferase-like glycosyltransferase